MSSGFMVFSLELVAWCLIIRHDRYLQLLAAWKGFTVLWNSNLCPVL